MKWLSLAYNALGDEGAGALGPALMSNDALEHLDVAGCNVGELGAVVLAARCASTRGSRGSG